VVIGTPYVEISCRALQHEHDLVIASAADDRGFKDIFRGATAVNLMRKCPSAVWLVKPGTAPRSPAIMAIIEAPTEGPSNALGIKVLDAATAMAGVWGADMHVVQSWEVHGNEAAMLRSEITDTTRHAILTKHEATHRKALEELLGRYRKSQVPMEVHLPKGRPAENVVTLADRLQVGLIVIGTEGRIGVSGLFNGSSAEQVLQDVDCDVLSVKPDHFRTPISNP
jgi:nucleotide-binding universal stress UspA family protein